MDECNFHVSRQWKAESSEEWNQVPIKGDLLLGKSTQVAPVPSQNATVVSEWFQLSIPFLKALVC